MKTNEIDQIIAEALEADKNKGKEVADGAHRRHGTRSLSTHRANRIATVRKILNVVFMIGFVAAVVIYFAMPEQRTLFFCVGFGAMIIKIIEFFLRFMF